ncbi:DUF2147 domain-containing protein [Gilvimarinus sp. DA14]|uniref:DUF2147 domain-containing protein n=1 Tax=Gilvimarinus sp. DA14 TaxID=2956798 RepID=UPI0020B83DBF|nr:DUF2147 domain-containing protein [Gilvimarinus sp. DA14]UTF58815.1 DUF2147 domain-containing protein [Gilvimarinus sp. DA14]
MAVLTRTTLALALFLLLGVATNLQAAPIEGRWITIDDDDGSEKSIVLLQVTDEGLLEGKIESLLQPESRGKVCKKCPGEFNNQPLEGLTFMWGLSQQAPSEWAEGKILDPKSGKVYKAKASLSEDQATLTVRGFIGFSLFGRSQTWRRAD